MSEAFAVEVNDRDFVNSLARGLEVIRVFTRHKPRMTLSEVAQSTDMTRATVRRFLLTLVREGYVETDGKYFSLRPKVLELGFSVLSSMNIWDVAQPIMNELSSQLQESCFAAILDRDSVIYVARANSNRLVNVGINIGSRVPAHCVSTGRVLLAALSDEALHALSRQGDARQVHAQHRHLEGAAARADRGGAAAGLGDGGPGARGGPAVDLRADPRPGAARSSRRSTSAARARASRRRRCRRRS